LDGNLSQLFQESIAQNIVLWESKSLIIYAVKWEWALARKLKRIGASYRPVDVSDAAAILRLMIEAQGAPLTRDALKGLNRIVYTPIEDKVLDKVAVEFEATYKFKGLI
jgi:hypothetical protein